MYKRILNSVTLVAFVIYSICSCGCTSTVRIPIDEVSTVPEKKITRLKLSDGEDVIWNYRGAEYDHSGDRFTGTFADDSDRFVRFSKVDSVYYLRGDSLTEYGQPADHFRSDWGKQKRGSIRGKIKGLSTGFKEYQFGKGDGKIDSLNLTVYGITKAGDSLEVPFNKITTLKVKRFSAGKTALLVAGLGALALMVGLAIAMDDYGITGGTLHGY